MKKKIKNFFFILAVMVATFVVAMLLKSEGRSEQTVYVPESIQYVPGDSTITVFAHTGVGYLYKLDKERVVDGVYEYILVD